VHRAWALLAAGRTDEAARAVDSFSPVPPGSQWGHLNAIFAHAVMGHTHGPEQAARSLASTMREAISRRPGIRSDVLQGFAYLAHLRGDEGRVQEITANTAPFGGGTIRNWLLLVPAGATHEDALEHLARTNDAASISRRFLLDAQHSQRLATEELERWS
jgi:hypothetical protein